MKTKFTKNLTSVAMLTILTPLLALAMIVSVRTAGIVGNDVLLLLLTLSSAVLSGINGFGRRTAKAVTHSHSTGRGEIQSYTWSARPRTNA